MNTREIKLTKISLTKEELTTLSNARDIIGDIIHFAGWKDLHVEDESAIVNAHLRKAWCVLDDLCGYQEFTI